MVGRRRELIACFGVQMVKDLDVVDKLTINYQ